MRIVATTPEYRPTWLHRDVLDRIWRASGSPYVASWHRAPIFPDWFLYEGATPVAFRTADMSFAMLLGAPSVYFIDGRHRTRWLMERFELVPVGLEEHHFGEATTVGLAVRPVDPEDTFPTFDY